MGVGKCLPGAATGALQFNNYTQTYQPANELCPVASRWNFIHCPKCQCNGHSTCNDTVDTGVLILNAKSSSKYKLTGLTQAIGDNYDGFFKCTQCENNTVGDQCETCALMHYGDALNGGTCAECACNDDAADCDRRTGRCYCSTKGVSGPHCESCDDNYIRDWQNKSCMFELAMDYIFTFNLGSTSPPDKYVTKINYVARPMRADVDVTFQLECSASSRARVNLTIYSAAFLYQSPIDSGARVDVTRTHVGATATNPPITATSFQPILNSPFRPMIIDMPCYVPLTMLFQHDDYDFSADANTTFFVNVADFSTPVILKVSVSIVSHHMGDIVADFICSTAADKMVEVHSNIFIVRTNWVE
jgi:hypothetical protein